MAMDLAVQKFSTAPEYPIADADIRITTAVKPAKAAVTRGMVVVLKDGKLEQPAVSGSSAPYTVATAGMYGIVADDAAAGKDAVVYLTGSFFADALVLPKNATAADVEIALREIGIFLK